MSSTEYDIRVFKLSSGEEFIARLTENGEEYVKFEHPVVAMHAPESGQLQFVPWMQFSGADDYALFHRNIMTMQPVVPALKDAFVGSYYEDNVIQVPERKIITG